MTDGSETLDELLSDPIIRLLMARDHVRAAEIRKLLRRAQRNTVRTPAPHIIERTRKQPFVNA